MSRTYHPVVISHSRSDPNFARGFANWGQHIMTRKLWASLEWLRRLERRATAMALLAILLAALAPAIAHDDGDDRDDEDAYAIGLWGDLPYSPAQAISGVPNLI